MDNRSNAKRVEDIVLALIVEVIHVMIIAVIMGTLLWAFWPGATIFGLPDVSWRQCFEMTGMLAVIVKTVRMGTR